LMFEVGLKVGVSNVGLTARTQRREGIAILPIASIAPSRLNF
jgi:hypothetical protein